MNGVKFTKTVIPFLMLWGITGNAYSREDHWTYPKTVDDFGKPLVSSPVPELPHAERIAGSRRYSAWRLGRGKIVKDLPKEANEPDAGPRFTASLLISMKRTTRIPGATLDRCETEMDECFKERLGRGFFVARASEACRVEDVCLLPISLDYAQFTLVSRMLKAQAAPKKKGEI